MSKDTLIVVVGAGASVKSGIPSSADLFKVARHALPQVRLPGAQYSIGDTFFGIDRYAWVSTLIERALHSAGMSVDFEVIVDVLEQLEAFVRTSDADTLPGNPFSRDYGAYGPVISAFADISSRYRALADSSLLHTSRMNVVRALHQSVGDAVLHTSSLSHPLARQNLKELFVDLSAKFRLVVITLNYDDLLDDMPIEWNDGFTNELADGISKSFSPTDWLRANADAEAHLLMHMHGSVRFGFAGMDALPALSRFGEPVRYASYVEASSTLQRGSSGTNVDGQILDGSAIISGRLKGGKLIFNPRPYGYYYRTMMTQLPHSKRLLILGYGGRDQHLNTWIDEHIALNSGRQCAVVGHRVGSDVGEETPQNSLLRKLAGADWPRLDASAYDRTGSFHVGGCLALLPIGFPLDVSDMGKIVTHLA